MRAADISKEGREGRKEDSRKRSEGRQSEEARRKDITWSGAAGGSRAELQYGHGRSDRARAHAAAEGE